MGANGFHGGRCCAGGHLGCAYGTPDDEERRLTPLRRALEAALSKHFCMSIVRVNDRATVEFPQSSPKARILAALDLCIKLSGGKEAE